MSLGRGSSTPEEVVLEHIAGHGGLHFPMSRRPDALASIARIMKEFGLRDADRLTTRLRTDRALFDALIDAVTVAETYFMRDPAQLQAIRNVILPALARDRLRDAPLRIWSAGCSTGEEAYSLALLLEEEGLCDRATILGTDLSAEAVRHARRAEYGGWSLRTCRDGELARYFTACGDRFKLVDRVRERVRFECLNLASQAYPSPATGTDQLDLILCRNVLIYLSPEQVKQVAARLYASLAAGGWLVAGASDPPLWAAVPFTTVVVPGAILYRKDCPSRSPASVAKGKASSRRLPPSLMPPRRLRARQQPVTPSPRPSARAGLERRFGSYEDRTDVQADTEAEWILRVRRLSTSADLTEAEKAAVAGLSRHPLSAELHYLRSILLIALDREGDALSALRGLLYLDRTLAAAHFTLGMLLQRRGDLSGARRSFDNAYRLCAARPPAEDVPLCEGETAGSLAEGAKAHLAQLRVSAKGS